MPAHSTPPQHPAPGCPPTVCSMHWNTWQDQQGLRTDGQRPRSWGVGPAAGQPLSHLVLSTPVGTHLPRLCEDTHSFLCPSSPHHVLSGCWGRGGHLETEETHPPHGLGPVRHDDGDRSSGQRHEGGGGWWAWSLRQRGSQTEGQAGPVLGPLLRSARHRHILPCPCMHTALRPHTVTLC